MSWWLLIIPLSTAFSAWLIFKLLITVIFRPYRPTRILGWKVQGILPSQQRSIATQTGKIVAEHFFSIDVIKSKLTNPSVLKKIMPAIEEHIDDFLRNKLKKQMPFIGMFIGDKTIDSVKQVFIKELETLFPKMIGDYAENLVNDLNIQTLVTDKINAIRIEEIENIFQKNLSRQLKVAEVAIIAIGLLIGFITALIIFLIK